LFPVRILAIQPARAPKTIQESQLKFETTGSMLRFLLIKLNEYQAFCREPGFGTTREYFSSHILYIQIRKAVLDTALPSAHIGKPMI
jgi:hypothetical protein